MYYQWEGNHHFYDYQIFEIDWPTINISIFEALDEIDSVEINPKYGPLGILYDVKTLGKLENLLEIKANYCVAKFEYSKWEPIYFGQTDDLTQRKFDKNTNCYIRNNATHLHVHQNPRDVDRFFEVSDLVSRWKPKCNKKLE